MKITVLGGGNGGLTAAYHLSFMGHEVCLYDSPAFGAQVKAVARAGGITALAQKDGDTYLYPGFQKITLATTDVKEAVSFAKVLVMICPSFAQEILFEQLLPWLCDGQILFVMPGNFGGLVLYRKLKESDRKELDITFVDAISIPWATRITSPGTIAMMGLKEFLPVSIFPKKKHTAEMEELVRSVLPIPAKFLHSPLEAGLENINFGGHPLMTTVNIGLLENFGGGFTYYSDCCSPSTAKATARMDEERLAVGKAYGLSLCTELEAMNALYAASAKTVYEFNRGSVAHGKVKDAPASAKARYITEDVPYLLVPIFLLGQLAGLKTPIMESIIHLAGAYNDADYFTEGRTLEAMGLGGKTPEEICRYLDSLNN